MSATLAADVAIVGAGIAGASLACWLAPHARVVIVERECHPGVHATGRSAAMFIESYGPPQVRALTRASRAFLERPPAGFAEVVLLAPRGALVVATEAQRASLEQHWDLLRAGASTARRLDADEAHALVPVLRRDGLAGAAYEPDATDIDVDALHQGYLRAARRAGATLICDAEVTAVERVGHDWELHTGTQRVRASVLVDAAGAWVDEVARLAGVPPIGIEPRRRTAFTFAAPDGIETARWPLVIGADEDWYLKPDAGQLLGSPANADPAPAHDVQAEELDVALGIHRIEQATTLTIRRPRRVWAGLRSFVADGELVGGFDDAAPGFFWLAGQGGYGIQTSAAMGEACAALVLGRPLPPRLAEFGLTAAMLSPARLRAADRRQ
ncbi:MAG: FAD-binding oxidoreductase [Burkholderiaceae bacterium]|jgi:D-arginine dehydrogenase|nr:FAD-binding oxidoreductase [Burkholderiaceae bacterium]